MLQDKEKWDRKYREKKYPTTPSQIVRNYFDLATGKKALDIGAGNGRNSLFQQAVNIASGYLIFRSISVRVALSYDTGS